MAAPLQPSSDSASPPLEWKPIEPLVEGWEPLSCAGFWEWRANPAQEPVDLPCLAWDWGHWDLGDTDPADNAVILRCEGPRLSSDGQVGQGVRSVEYFAAQCDARLRDSNGWSTLVSQSRLKHKHSSDPTELSPGGSLDCVPCGSIALVDQPMVAARDELLIRFVPPASPASAAPIRVVLRAKTRIRITGRLEVTNCIQSTAGARLHAKTDFKPGIWSAEIAEEMALENNGTRSLNSDFTLISPGHMIPIGGGVTVGGGPTGVQLGWQASTAVPPALKCVEVDIPLELDFYAKWCVSPPPEGGALDFAASVDLEVDTHARQTSAWQARATAEAKTLVLKFAHEPLPGESPCAPRAGGQPAVGPIGFPGGGTGG